MKLALFALGAVAAQYEYDDFGYKKKKNGAANPFHWKNGETDPCGCTNVPRNSPEAFGVCNMTETELANLPSNKQKVQRAHVRIWWTCPASASGAAEDISVLYTDRCKRLKKRPLETTFPEWPSPCGDISGSCKCQQGMTTLMSEAAWTGASFQCTDDGRKHSTYRITCGDGTTAEGRVKCKNNFVRRMNGDLRNFSCAGRGNKRG